MEKQRLRNWLSGILFKYREEYDWKLDDDVYLDELIKIIDTYHEIKEQVK